MPVPCADSENFVFDNFLELPSSVESRCRIWSSTAANIKIFCRLRFLLVPHAALYSIMKT